MQDRKPDSSTKTSCDARPDHTLGQCDEHSQLSSDQRFGGLIPDGGYFCNQSSTRPHVALRFRLAGKPPAHRKN